MTPQTTAAAGPAQVARKKVTLNELVEKLYGDIQSDLAKDKLVLPSLPDIALKIWSVVESPNASSQKIAKTIAADPALSARLLRVANSAYFHGSAPVSDLRRAITRLGSELVKHVVTILGVAQLYDVKAHPNLKPHLTATWEQSTLIAGVSDVLAAKCPNLESETAMLAGLVHNIGVLPILVRAERIPALMANPPVLTALLSRLHSRVGKAVVEHWRFPTDLIKVVAEHEDLKRESVGLPEYVDVVQVANLLSHRDTNHPLAQVDYTDVPAIEVLGLSVDELDDVLRYAGNKVGELRTLLAH